MNDDIERLPVPNSIGALVVEFLRHTSGAIFTVAALFALIGYMYFEGAANPQKNMHHVPLAIVNEDTGASIDTPIGPQQLRVGDQLVGGMLDGNDFSKINMRVVDRAEAEGGMRDGEFYGMVDVPSSLSADVAALISGSGGNGGATAVPERPTVTVLTAPRASVSAPQLTAGLVAALQEKLPQQAGRQTLDNARKLADAQHTEMSPAAALALADPIELRQATFEPLSNGVTNASFPLFYALVLVLAGFTGAMVVSQLLDSRLGFIPLEVGPFVRLSPLGAHSRLRVLLRKWIVTVIIGPLIAAITAAIAHGVGVTGFPYWSTFLVSVLTILAVGTAAHAVNAIFGSPGMLINLIVFVVLGIPTSGGAIPSEMLPRAFAAIGSVEPMHQAVMATRALLFFDDPWSAGLGSATWILTVWLVAALVIGTAVVMYYDAAGLERKPRPRTVKRVTSRVGSTTATADGTATTDGTATDAAPRPAASPAT